MSEPNTVDIERRLREKSEAFVLKPHLSGKLDAWGNLSLVFVKRHDVNDSASSDFYRAMRCISAVFAVMQCLSVCPSVTFVDHVKTNKDIFKTYLPSGSDTILVFPSQRACRYSDGNPPSNARGV